MSRETPDERTHEEKMAAADEVAAIFAAAGFEQCDEPGAVFVVAPLLRLRGEATSMER